MPIIMKRFEQKRTTGILAALLLPATLLAQNVAKDDSLRGVFLQTVTISSSTNNAGFNGRRYDGQARTERLLDNLPGVELISRGNFAQEPVLRGMADGQINITINSMHLFGACTDRMDPISSYIEPNNLQSLQVCSSPCFNSSGATIGGGLDFNLREARPDAPKKITGSVGTGFETNASARQFLGTLQYSGKRFAFSVDGIFRKAGDYTPGGHKNHNIDRYGAWTPDNGFSVDGKGRINFSQYEKWNAHANARYELNQHQTLSADYLQDDADNTGYPALTMDMRFARSKTISLTHEYRNTDKALYYWQTKVYYNDIDHAMDNGSRPMEQMPMGMMMDMRGHSQTAGAYTQAYWKPAAAQLIRVKMETYSNRWHADMNMIPMDTSGGNMAMSTLTIPDARRTVVGMDISDEFAISPFWRIIPGIHTEYSRSSITTAQGKDTIAMIYPGNPDHTGWLYNAFVELSYRPQAAFEFDLNLARGMRAPTIKEMYSYYLYNRVDGFDYIGNPGIKNESSYNAEVDVVYRQKTVEATIKGFGYFFQHYIAGFVQPNMMPMTPGAVGVKQYGNSSSASIVGASLLFSWHLSPQLLFSSNTTWEQGQDNNKNYLPLITPLRSINNMSYTAGSWRLFVQALAAAARNRASSFYGETPDPGFFVADAGADKTIALSGARLILGVNCNNIFNTWYYETPDVIKLPRQGRNLIIHATYSF